MLSVRPRAFSHPVQPLDYAVAAAPGVAAFQEVIDGLSEQICILDGAWNVLAVNRTWAESAAAAVLVPGIRVGENYLVGCETLAAKGNRDALILLQGIRQIVAGRRKFFEHVYTKSEISKQDYKVNITRFESGGSWFATVTRYDVTKLMSLTRQYRRLERSLIRVQEEERRRIGRDLHDATAQLLVALHLNIIRLKAIHGDEETVSVVGELGETLGRINHEIRAISYLLHPPSLEDGGLVESLDAMARGFSRRTGLKIGFWFDGQRERWEPIVEGTLYRLAQEALANVHRHAHASMIGIRLVARRDYLHLIIEDDGVGIPIESANSLAPLGVGIAGMRSRIDELSGRFSIRRMETGTCLIASIPLASDQLRGIDLIG
ncbi:MAG: sensor histidine kinase [Allosphingosinicella sp.]